MFKKYIQILSNPLLYYTDKTTGSSVFRNFCLVKETGNLYKMQIPKENVGKALEYRFQLDNYLNLTYILTTILLYLIFIHLIFSLGKLIFFEILWIIIVTSARMTCSYFYHEYLISHFGKYEITEFRPPVPKRKIDEYLSLFKSKIIVILIVIALFLAPSIFLRLGIKYSLTPKFNGFKRAVTLSNVYLAIYPKEPRIYDMRAYGKYMTRDYEGALKDYKKVLDISGKRFTKHDIVRFENLLLLQKRLTTAQEAVDIFNEYITKKKMSPLEASQMLWIKSIFQIENNITETIMQDYYDLLESLDEKDSRNKFYISCDRAYMMYLMQDYQNAISAYNVLISYAEANKKDFSKELQSLYAERGWAKRRLGDIQGASLDYVSSKIPTDELAKYEPTYSNQIFVADKF